MSSMKTFFITSLIIFSYSLQAMEQQQMTEEAQRRRITATESLTTLKREDASMTPGWGKKLTEDPKGTVSRQTVDSLKLDPDFNQIMNLVKNNKRFEIYKDTKKLQDRTGDEKLYLIHFAAENKKFEALLILLEIFENLSLKNYKRLYECPKIAKSITNNCTLLTLAIANRDLNLARELKRHGMETSKGDEEIALRMAQIGSDAEMAFSQRIQEGLFGTHRVFQGK